MTTKSCPDAFFLASRRCSDAPCPRTVPPRTEIPSFRCSRRSSRKSNRPWRRLLMSWRRTSQGFWTLRFEGEFRAHNALAPKSAAVAGMNSQQEQTMYEVFRADDAQSNAADDKARRGGTRRRRASENERAIAHNDGHCEHGDREIVIDLDESLLDGPLSLKEVRSAFVGLEHEYPPRLTLDAAAELACMSPQTLKKQVSEGLFDRSVKRGKPLLFWRDRFLVDLFAKRDRRVPRRPSSSTRGAAANRKAVRK